MCNRYVSPADRDIERQWQLVHHTPWLGGGVYPRAAGAFIRAAGQGRELVVGQWGLIPWFAKEARLTYSTQNARFEEIAAKPSYKLAWARGQRCIIPAASFDEPCWESGKNEWWTFRRRDGTAWGLAGLWNAWVDRASGEILESYTLLTANADAHPLMKRMHKPDPKLGPDEQDKRSVLVVPIDAVDAWLSGAVDSARSALRLPVVDEIEVSTGADARPAGLGA